MIGGSYCGGGCELPGSGGGGACRGKTGPPRPLCSRHPTAPLRPHLGPLWGTNPPPGSPAFQPLWGSRVLPAAVGSGRRGSAGRLFRGPVPVPVLMGVGQLRPSCQRACGSERSERGQAPVAPPGLSTSASLRPRCGLVRDGASVPGKFQRCPFGELQAGARLPKAPARPLQAALRPGFLGEGHSAPR